MECMLMLKHVNSRNMQLLRQRGGKVVYNKIINLLTNNNTAMQVKEQSQNGFQLKHSRYFIEFFI